MRISEIKASVKQWQRNREIESTFNFVQFFFLESRKLILTKTFRGNKYVEIRCCEYSSKCFKRRLV